MATEEPNQTTDPTLSEATVEQLAQALHERSTTMVLALAGLPGDGKHLRVFGRGELSRQVELAGKLVSGLAMASREGT